MDVGFFSCFRDVGQADKDQGEVLMCLSFMLS